MAQKPGDIFILSFRADGIVRSYRISEREGKAETDEFADLRNIIFMDTANKKDTDLLSYMKRFNFNEDNGDGELVIGFGAAAKNLMMIAVHNTNLGPALGGLREKAYHNFDSMLTDALRLSRAMTYKAAMADTKTGGGKAARLIPAREARSAANKEFARVINFINEERKKRSVNPYVTAEDSNTCCQDFDEIGSLSDEVTCKSINAGGSGNPSPITAIGVYHAAKAGAEFAFAGKTLGGKVVLISGIGQCGYELAKNYLAGGVGKVICAELSEERIEWVKRQFGKMGEIDRIEFLFYTKEQLKNQEFLADLANKVDIFSPCALGRSIDSSNISVFKNSRLRLICGSENNQLADEEKHGSILHEMGIVYVPDYVANAGGLINCAKEIHGRMFLISETIKEAMNIENTVRRVLSLSKEKNIPAYLAANQMAQERFMRRA